MWDGGTARQLGLVDGFGGLDEAVAAAAGLAKLGDERGVRYLDRSPSFAEELMAAFAGEDAEAAPTDALAALAPAPERLLDSALADLRRILSGPSIQLRCLDCPVELSSRAEPERSGWKVALLGWLS